MNRNKKVGAHFSSAPSYMEQQQCWLRSVTPITWFKYANEDELTCLLPVTPSRLAKGQEKVHHDDCLFKKSEQDLM
ncbi:hypothetical protein GA047_08735 [Vibrio cholerae]|nr:hypothetical protein [Vibrio cholerae]